MLMHEPSAFVASTAEGETAKNMEKQQKEAKYVSVTETERKIHSQVRICLAKNKLRDVLPKEMTQTRETKMIMLCAT